MRSIPFGYCVVNGHAEKEPEEAKGVQKAFDRYLAGESLDNIDKEIGLDRGHVGVSRLLKDKRYLGTDFYPQIIDRKTFDDVQKVREERSQKHARPERKRVEPVPRTKFIMEKEDKKFDDPFEKAQYRYSLIKTKEETDG